MQKLQDNNDRPSSRKQEKEWIGESNIINGALAGLGLIMMQPFMYQGEYTGLAAKVCVISFAISTPLLAALILINYEENFTGRMSASIIASIGKAIAHSAAAIGFVAAFWHINPLAGKAALVSCILAVIVQSAGYTSLFMPTRKK